MTTWEQQRCVVVRCTAQLTLAMLLSLASSRCSPVMAFARVHARSRAPLSGRWVETGASPGADLGHRPQGMTVAGDDVLMTNHHHDAGSTLFRYDRRTFTLRQVVSLPAEATHPGGLACDGADLWMVDYNSNRLYRIDLEATFARGFAVVVASYPTGLDGTSALAIVKVGRDRLLAISDFGVPGEARTYLVRIEKVAGLAERPLAEVADLSYENGAFSQGLAWDGAFLYEAVNTVGRDEIRILDVSAAIEHGDASLVMEVGRIEAPSDAVEDLETDGETIWTSDEESFRTYRLTGLGALRRQLGIESSEVAHEARG